VTSHGKAILVTGCETPLAWYLCKKLDDMGFTVFAGFKDVADNADAELLKDECSARVKVLQLDSSSETQVKKKTENCVENSINREIFSFTDVRSRKVH
jgi:3-hydroxybutyrate dehydrogenase